MPYLGALNRGTDLKFSKEVIGQATVLTRQGHPLSFLSGPGARILLLIWPVVSAVWISSTARHHPGVLLPTHEVAENRQDLDKKNHRKQFFQPGSLTT